MHEETREWLKVTGYVILWLLLVSALFYLILVVDVPREPKEGALMNYARRLLAALLLLLPTGCSLAPSDDVLRELVKNERSWCLIVNTVYGTARIAGTGIRNGTVSCSQEGMVVKSDAPR